MNGPDLPMLQGLFLVFSAAVIVFNLLADLLYAYLDPRVRDGMSTVAAPVGPADRVAAAPALGAAAWRQYRARPRRDDRARASSCCSWRWRSPRRCSPTSPASRR